MGISVMLWGACALFAIIMFLCVREATALSLFFAAVNALTLSFFHGDLKISATVFAVSFGAIMIFAAIASVVIDAKSKKQSKIKKR